MYIGTEIGQFRKCLYLEILLYRSTSIHPYSNCAWVIDCDLLTLQLIT